MDNEIIAFSLPKIGEAEKNIQDSFDSSPERKLAAMSDGAGSSLYPRKWADILVQSFCKSQENPIESIKISCQEWLKPLQEEWRQYYLEKVRSSNRKWWTGGSSTKDHGSATFIGLSFQDEENDSEKGKWQAVAVGDSCLFKLESNTQKLTAFPINDSQKFKSVTPCLASLPEYKSSPPNFHEGCYEDGDIFLLTTDALAQWLLADYENNGDEWKQIFAIKERDEFVSLITQLRQNKLIKNDDTTVALIKTPEEIPEEIPEELAVQQENDDPTEDDDQTLEQPIGDEEELTVDAPTAEAR